MALREQPITAPSEAWPIESRREMMRDIIRMLAERNVLKIENAPAIAQTYGLKACEAEAECMRHLSEGEGK